MIVYAETNFVLELVLRQEQHRSCEELLGFAGGGQIELALPAMSLLEPYFTLERRSRSRKELIEALRDEIGQLKRTQDFGESLEEAEQLYSILVDVSDQHWRRLGQIRETLTRLATVLPTDGETLRRALLLQDKHDLRSEDANVLASVLRHLEATSPVSACFLNRDAKDFSDPELIDELKTRSCRFIPSFENGVRFIQSELQRSLE